MHPRWPLYQYLRESHKSAGMLFVKARNMGFRSYRLRNFEALALLGLGLRGISGFVGDRCLARHEPMVDC